MSRFNIALTLTGYCICSVTSDKLEAVINLCSANGIAVFNIRKGEERSELCVRLYACSRFLLLCQKHSLEVSLLRRCGLPVCFERLLHRPGIAVGLLSVALLVFLSGRVVWDIRVKGCECMSEREVISLLEECGVEVGTPISKIDEGAVENGVRILSDKISWISVNLKGTVAEVEILEREAPLTEDTEQMDAANMIAAKGGVVVAIEGEHGSLAVKIGDAVGEGQLLIGGIYGDENRGFSYTVAEGKVFAKVTKEFELRIPRKYDKKIYSGEEKCEKFIIFFKKQIKFFSNCGNLYPTYDKIDTEEFLPVSDRESAPFGVRTVRYLEYTTEESEYTDEELRPLAEYKLSSKLNEELRDAELLSKSVDISYDEYGCRIICKFRCIENIAVRQEIKVLP